MKLAKLLAAHEIHEFHQEGNPSCLTCCESPRGSLSATASVVHHSFHRSVHDNDFSNQVYTSFNMNQRAIFI